MNIEVVERADRSALEFTGKVALVTGSTSGSLGVARALRQPMIYRIAGAAALLMIGGSALAAGDGAQCAPVSKFASSPKDGITVSRLSPGQFNFLRGFYAAISPSWKTATLPASGALLIEHKGDKGGILMLVTGALACAPTAAAPEFIDAIKATKTGALDASGTEI